MCKVTVLSKMILKVNIPYAATDEVLYFVACGLMQNFECGFI